MIDFVEKDRIRAHVDAQASTNACGIAIQVLVQGSEQNFSAQASGRDEQGDVRETDILACLQFGLRLRHFEGPQGASFKQAVPGGLDTLWNVSGIGQEVRRILPFEVDELKLTSRWSSLSRGNTTWILVGKNLTQRFSLQYARSLENSEEQFIALKLRLSNNTDLNASWMLDDVATVGDLGIDAQFHWEFR